MEKICKKILFLIINVILSIIIASSIRAATYYVDINGNDSNPGSEALPWRTIQKAANSLQAGDMVYVKQGTYNERVVPQNSGTATAYITYAAYPGHVVTIDGSNVILPQWSGLVDIQEIHYIRISGFRIINAGPWLNNAGILIDSSSNIIIENNYIYNTKSSGIGIWSSSYVIAAGNEISLCCNDGEQECISVAGSDHFEIKGNNVHHGGPGSNGGEGIDIKDGSHDGKVYKNNIYNMKRVALYLDAWDKHTYNVEVYQNRVYNNNSSGIAIASEMGGLLDNIKIYNNISYNNYYIGLVIADWGGQVSSHPLNNIKIINNTFYGNGTSGWGGGISIDNEWATNVVIRNNLISANESFTIVLEPSVPTPIIDYNLIDGFEYYPNETKGVNYQEGNPLLVNPSSGNFHLQINSPAIDNGSSIEAPVYDYDGVQRQGSGYEIGAFEYQIIAPNITASHNPVNFSNVLLNNISVKSITVKNNGTANLLIDSITTPELPFSIIEDNCSLQNLPPGSTCQLDIGFQPTATGTYISNINILSNAPLNSIYQIDLLAVGVSYMMYGLNIYLYNDATNIWEIGETVVIAPSWVNNSTNNINNVTGVAVCNDSTIVLEGYANYGNIAAGSTASCINTGNCYSATAIGPRPQTHWDVLLSETLSTSHIHEWKLHIGASFYDVSLSNLFYPYIETLLHSGVSEGCNANHYCPLNNVIRSQMAKFICSSMEIVSPGSCSNNTCSEIFQDVLSNNIFCSYIEALYSIGIVSGCNSSPLMYCPSNNTQRQAMAKFICLSMEAANPGSCLPSSCLGIFNDVQTNNPFCSYIETLYTANIISGCQASPLLYCPNNNVSREQMSKYLVKGFNFSL